MTAPALHADQEAALRLATDPAGPRILVVTGSPGTGKTTLVRAIIEHFEREDRKVLLAAPTGKAALRLSQQTGRTAATIHRLLEPMPVLGGRGEGGAGAGGPKFRFARDAANPLETDVLVLDEVSMVDVPLAASVCRALPVSSRLRRLIIVGDLDQLPAVGPGQVLGDLIASGMPVARLTTIKRQNPGALLTAIHAIKEGRVPVIANRAGEDLFVEEILDADVLPDARVVGASLDEWGSIPEEDDPASEPAGATSLIADRILDLALSRLPAALPRMFPEAFPPDRPVDRLRDIQVITPTRDKGPLSAKALGERFQARLEAERAAAAGIDPEASPTPGKLRDGDKVIQLKNDYDLGICNGDIGFLQRTVEDGERRKFYEVLFDAYPGRPVRIPCASHHLTLAYAVTCHKFQGSEAPVVVIPLHRSFPGLLMTRNWIYTAISRARTLCVLVGDPEVLARAVRRTNPTRRVTALVHMVRAAAADSAANEAR